MARRIQSVSRLKKELDKVYSHYIRLKECLETTGNPNQGICFTCGTRHDFKNLQCGHYIPRNHNSTRYYEKNTHIQDVRCNIFLRGNLDVYALSLISKYGDGILDELNKMKNTIKNFTKDELLLLIHNYKQKLRKLEETYA